MGPKWRLLGSIFPILLMSLDDVGGQNRNGYRKVQNCRGLRIFSKGGVTGKAVEEGLEIVSVSLLADRSRRGKKCVYEETYEWNDIRIKVWDGCKGVFKVCVKSTDGSEEDGKGSEQPHDDDSYPEQTVGNCKETNMRSRHLGHQDTEMSRTVAITSVNLVREFSRNKCVLGITYGFQGMKAYARGMCQGRFRICTGGDDSSECSDDYHGCSYGSDDDDDGDDRDEGRDEEICTTKIVISNPFKDRDIQIGGLHGGSVNILSVNVFSHLTRIRCVLGSTFVIMEDRLVVRRGCGARFRVCYKEHYLPPKDHPGNDLPEPLPVKQTCKQMYLKSDAGTVDEEKIKVAPGKIPFITNVELVREYSRRRCEEWKTFYGQDNKLTAKDGCNGYFRVCYDVYSY